MAITTYNQIKDVYMTDLSAGVVGGSNDVKLNYSFQPVGDGELQLCTLNISGISNFEIYANTDLGATEFRKIRYIYEGSMAEFGTLSNNAGVSLFSGYGLTENSGDPDFQNRTVSTFYKPDGETLYVKLPDGTEYSLSDVPANVTHIELLTKSIIDNLAKSITMDSQDLLDPLFARNFKFEVNTDGTCHIEYTYCDMDGNAILDVDGHDTIAMIKVEVLTTPIPSVDFEGVTFTKSLTIISPEFDVDGFVVAGGTSTTVEGSVSDNYNLLAAGNMSIGLFSLDGNPVTINGNTIEKTPFVINHEFLPPSPVTRGVRNPVVNNITRRPIMTARSNINNINYPGQRK